MKTQPAFALSFFLLLCTQASAWAESKPITEPKFESTASKTKVKGFDEASVTASAQFNQYQTFFIEPAEIEFDKHWRRDIRFDMSDRDEQRITTNYSEALTAALQKTLLEKTNLTAATTITANTLVIKPNLTNFRITAPDLSFTGITKNYVDYVGSARVHFTLKDGIQQNTLAKLSDHDLTRSFNGIMELKPTNRAENMHDFKRLYRRWAIKLSRFLTDSINAEA